MSVCLAACKLLLEKGMVELVDKVVATLKSRSDIVGPPRVLDGAALSAGHPEHCKNLMAWSLRKAAEAVVGDPQA